MESFLKGYQGPGQRLRTTFIIYRKTLLGLIHIGTDSCQSTLPVQQLSAPDCSRGKCGAGFRSKTRKKSFIFTHPLRLIHSYHWGYLIKNSRMHKLITIKGYVKCIVYTYHFCVLVADRRCCKIKDMLSIVNYISCIIKHNKWLYMSNNSNVLYWSCMIYDYL